MGMGAFVVVTVLVAMEREAVAVRLQPASNLLEQASIQQRVSLVGQSLEVIWRRPLTGVGGNNFVAAEEHYLRLEADGQSPLLPVHDTYLLAQAELGPVGAASWLALMAAPLVELARRRRKRYPEAPFWEEDETRGTRPGTEGEWRARVDMPSHVPGRSLEQPLPDQRAAHAWHALAGCSLIVVAVAGIFDFYIWVNEPVAALWIVSLAIFSTSPNGASRP